MAEADWVRDTDGGAEIALWVQPRAAKNQVAGLRAGRLAVRVTAPPVEDAANKATAALIAEVLRVRPGAVTLAAGRKQRQKRVRVRGLDAGQVRRLLAAHL